MVVWIVGNSSEKQKVGSFFYFFGCFSGKLGIGLKWEGISTILAWLYGNVGRHREDSGKWRTSTAAANRNRIVCRDSKATFGLSENGGNEEGNK